MFERDNDRTAKIVAAVDGNGDPEDNVSRLFAQYAGQSGNDSAALSAVLKQPQRIRLTDESLAGVNCEILVIVGDKDFVYPADQLVDALPNAQGTVLKNVDHFATPESFDFVDAVLEFLDAIPT